MKKCILWLIVSTCIIGCSYAGCSSAAEATGFVSCKDKKLILVDAFAVWNSEENELSLYLFPSKITSEDRADLQSNNAWLIRLRKETPDKTQWESWYPYLNIDMKFAEGTCSRESMTFCNFIFVGLEKKDFPHNANRNKEEIQKEIIDLSFNKKTLTLKSKGSSGAWAGGYIWDVSVTCPVVKLKEN